MKKVITTAVAASLISIAIAQVKTPQGSTKADFETTVGLTEIEIEYFRPKKNNRVIFGDVVPFDKMWRTGANKNTVIEFSDDVKIGDQPLKKGKYAIYTKPGKDSWEVYFYSNTENWGMPNPWDDSKVVAKYLAKVTPLSSTVETFTISIDDLTIDQANLTFSWDNVRVAVPITVPTDEKVMATIDNTMKGGTPTAADFMSAANYYVATGRDAQQAKEWMDKGMSMISEPQYYQIHQQAIIYAKAGDYKGAIELAKKSLDAAKKAGSDEYIKKNETMIKEWSKK
ncbi:MAG: DUF2911 domain-containing protein [Crocinitomicaceae bacterium]|nr:DUF2911 domain-containing protein [Crocinitomicaceae bacterium]